MDSNSGYNDLAVQYEHAQQAGLCVNNDAQ
jgi:hypothetical protein